MYMFFISCFLGLALSLFSGEGTPANLSEQVTAGAQTIPAANMSGNPYRATVEKEANPSSYLQFGANYTWTWIKPRGLDSTWGNTGGIQGSYEYKPENGMYGALTFAWRQGNTEGNDSNTERSLCFIDAQERIGYSVSRCHEWTCSLFSGLGYRHYGEDVTTGINTVTFDYNELYIPVGFLLNSRKMEGRTSVGFNAIWMPQAYPTVKIVPLEGARWILTTELANFRVEFPITWNFPAKYHGFISLVPLFEYWTDGKTTATTELGTTLDIPRNTYIFAGVNLNFGYVF